MPLARQPNRYRVNEQEEFGEEWLLTYADAITLLMSFFLVMISISKVDMALFEQIKSGIRSEIRDEKIKTPLSDIKRTLDSLLAEEKKQKKVGISLTDKFIVLEFASAAFYHPGEAEIGESASRIIDKVTSAVAVIDYYPFALDVEGHTDDVPISTMRYPSNWELSVNRATNIVKYMIESGVHPTRLKAAGYADTKPKLPNRDPKGDAIPDNQAANRRIVMRIH